jgi:peptidoglycan/xylan/chitin deacetylase (PgdA/CDA1 family)
VPPRNFKAQVGLLAARGYRGVTFTEAVLGEPSGKVVAVTFDDGYSSVHEIARPVLDRHGMPATVFVPTAHMDSGKPMRWEGIDKWVGGPHEHELLPLSWEQVRSLAGAGWEIGSHTVSHPHLPALDDTRLRAELAESRQVCAEMTGVDCTSVAFPYGESDLRVQRAAEAAGYSVAAALSTEQGEISAFARPRVSVYQIDGLRTFRVKVSPTLRRLHDSWLWRALRSLLHSIRRG